MTQRILALLLVIVILVTGCQGSRQPEKAALAIPTPIPTPAVAREGWALVWNDEFDGDGLNHSNWTFDLGGGGWGNGEAQVYTDLAENVRVQDGLLVIEARKETNATGGFQFTSARLKTQGLKTFQYGRIEARLKVPAGAGIWPAFWMLGSNIDQVGWPDCGEIDIMEYVGRDPNLIMGTLHGPGYSGALGLTSRSLQDYPIADDFHTYAIEWDQNQISWFYDDVEYHTLTREDVGNDRWVFDQPFFLILNLALGGTLGGFISPETVFPAQVYADYVRVYQKAP
ncbi:MAG: glycoside hydrolase family 16 protein [Anaerolineae bacterium]